MKNNLLMFLHFLSFLFTPEDSSQCCDSSNIHAAKKEVANKAKFLFWFSLSIAFALMIANLH